MPNIAYPPHSPPCKNQFSNEPEIHYVFFYVLFAQLFGYHLALDVIMEVGWVLSFAIEATIVTPGMSRCPKNVYNSIIRPVHKSNGFILPSTPIITFK